MHDRSDNGKMRMLRFGYLLTRRNEVGLGIMACRRSRRRGSL